MKIKSIKEKVPQATTLPDGIYIGTWGGYCIDFRYKDKTYELETEEVVRGMDIVVAVIIKDGEVTFEEIKN